MNKIEIGKHIKSLRTSKGWSQQLLAEKAGITRRQQIIEIENASTDYGIDVLIKVTKALDNIVDISENIKLPSLLGESFNESNTFDFSKIDSPVEEIFIFKTKKKIK